MNDAWPRTGRWLPWLIAGFVVLVWVFPVDSIAPRKFTAFDLKLDRVALGLVLSVWLAALCAGGPLAPRVRGMGAIGKAVVIFLLVALFSVVFDMETLLIGGQTSLVTKKLVLLASYVVFFYIVATTIRRDEVEPLLRMFVWTGAIVGVLVAYERLSGTNVFFELADKLPKSFVFIREVPSSPFVPTPVTGPARHGLGISGMLAMAAPLAMVQILASSGRRRLVGTLLLIAILAGVWGANRKTGAFASVAAIATVAVYRPQDMLFRVVPAVFVGVLAIAVIKPSAVRFELQRVSPNAVTSGISSQGRSADYPAIVPDFRAHPLLGRGWGSYTHQLGFGRTDDRFRTLDNNWLSLLIETGVLGVVAFASMLFSVWAAAHRALRRAGFARAGPLLGISGAASAFAVSMALFDALSFPQVPYFFFFLAGLLVAARRPDEVPAAAAVRAPRLAPAPALR